jgi:hypothetical protein
VRGDPTEEQDTAKRKVHEATELGLSFTRRLWPEEARFLLGILVV